MSQFDQIIAFLWVAETKSFTAAADKLGVSANAVSKQVTQLEQQLGLTLLSRSTRQLSLTEQGKMIYEKGKILRQDMEDIQGYAQSMHANPSGALLVVSSLGVGQYLLAPRLANFLRLYPQLKLDLKFSDEFPDFATADIAFGFPASLMPAESVNLNLVRRRMYSIERIICAAPAYLSLYGEPQTYSDLNKHCYIAHSQNSRNPLLRECEKQGVSFSRILTVNNTLSILNMLLNGDGIASTPDFVVAKPLAAGAVKRILQNHREPKVPVYLFYKKSRYLPVNISRFIDFFSNLSSS